MSESPLRVLLVDDEASLRDPLAKYLRREYGYEVKTAASAKEALTQIELAEGQFDVALIDDMLTPAPGRDPEPFGIKLMIEIRAQHPRVEFILFTGWGMESAIEALRAGAYRYLRKPFDREELAVLIEHAAEYRRLKGVAREKQILERLVEIGGELTSDLELDHVLNSIAQQIARLVEASRSLFLLVDMKRRCLIKATGYGYPPNHLEQLTFEEVEQGVSGWVLKTGKSVVVRDAQSDPRNRGVALERAKQFDTKPLIVAPLVVKGEVVGTLTAVNTADDPPFTQEDLNLVAMLANQAAIALVNAELVAQLSEQKDHYARLTTSSPHGIIAIDSHGKVTGFNDRSQEILGYESDEVLGESVKPLYNDPQEPQRIGRLMRAAADGKLANYETFVRSKERERIPIRLTATWLYNAQGQRIGSVGYFEDLRSIKEAEGRVELLLKASNIVAQAGRLTEGLHQLAEMIVTHLNTTFCRIFLLDESQQFLVAEALCPIARAVGGRAWLPELREQFTVADWPKLAELLAHGGPRVFRMDEPPDQHLLTAWSRGLGLDAPIQSLLSIPLQTQDRVVGLIELGEARHWKRASFSPEKQELAVAIAEQTAVLIDRMRLHSITERRRQLLTALDEASRHIRAEREMPKLLQEVVRLAAELVGCDAGGLYLNHPHLETLELAVTYGFPEPLADRQLPHTDGLFGAVARTGESRIIHDYATSSGRAAAFEPYRFQTVTALPLRQTGVVEAVLFVADSTGRQPITASDLDILERFATQASIALQTSRLMGREQRMFAHLAILHRISDYIQAAGDLDKILHVVLTGVTAGYGLGFNRAALLLLDVTRESLVGRMGVGHLDESLVRFDWAHDPQDFKWYLEQLEHGTVLQTEIGERIGGLCLAVSATAPDVFSRTVSERRWTMVTQDDLNQLPESFIEVFQPALPLVVVPLRARDQVIGILVADNKFTRSPITTESVESLLNFANTAAIAIDKTRLLHETEVARERLHSFYQASNALVSSHDPERILQDIVGQARVAADASGVSVILIDEIGQARDLASTGIDKPGDVTDVMRPDGLSMRVLRTGVIEVIEDTSTRADVNPSWLWRRVAAALCLPVSLEGRRIGVMWFHYDRPRSFSKAEIDAAKLYVNQAALAYDSSRRIKELEHMHQAAQMLAEAAGLKEILEQIVRSAREVLQADSAVIWSYHVVQNRFIPESWAAPSVSAEVWEAFQKDEPRRGGTAYTVMQQRWVGVRDVSDTQQYTYLGDSSRKLLKRISAQSFQGIALSVGDEWLGLLYVNYNRPRSFSITERQTAQTFANHAALALKKAKLLDQLSKARNTAHVVAMVTVLEDLRGTLHSVAEGMKGVLSCDAVTVYVYDQHKNQFEPPITVGVWHYERASGLSGVLKDSIVFKMLERDQPYIVDEISVDPLFKDTRFARDEQVASCVAISLKVGSEGVGVIFVNYRSQHRFTTDELTNIELFANQAAVAIHNAQLYERLQKRAGALEVLYAAGRAVTSSLDLDETLNQLAEQAWSLTGYEGKHASFADIMLVEGTRATFVASYPRDELPKICLALGDAIDLTTGRNGRIGITGRVIKTKQPQLVRDITENPDYLESRTETISELAVPIKIGLKVIGVINVEHPERNVFDKQDERDLEALAAQAAIAISNAQLYKQVQKRAVALQTLYDAGQVVISTLSLPEILNRMVEQAYKLMDSHGKRSHLSHLALVEENSLKFTTAYPPEVLPQLREQVGHQIDLRKKRGRRIGITGRVVITGKSQCVGEVKKNKDYIEYDPNTHSELAVPIRIRGEVIGVINVEHSDYDAFDKEDQHALESLAAQAAIAIQNARLFEQTKKAAERLTAIYQISTATIASEKLWEEILHVALLEMVKVFEVNQGGVVLFDWETGQGHTVVEYPETRMPQILIPLQENASVKWILAHRQPLVIEDALDDPLLASMREAVAGWQVKSMLLVPLIVRGEVIGAIGLDTTEHRRRFSPEECDLAQTMANHVANALANAQLYEEIQRRLKEQILLHKVALAASSAIELDKVLQATADSIAESLEYESVGIQLIDETTQDLTGTYYFAGPEPRAMNTSKDHGITGRVLREGKSALVPDVSLDPDYVPGILDTRSEMCVPLQIDHRVVGVINIESNELNAFKEHDLRLMETIAGQVVDWIENARLYTQLEKTQEMLAARTALAWMGTLSSTWRHTIANHAITIQDLVVLTEQDITAGLSTTKLWERLKDINEMARMIREAPITAPLSSEEGVVSVSINELLRERVGQLWKSEPYRSIKPQLDFKLDDIASVRTSPDWLRRAFDILVDNAINAMAETPIKQLTLSTCRTQGGVEICLADTGRGIPEEMRLRLFRDRIEKPKGTKGLGMGLLLAQLIVHMHRGEISLKSTSPTGTTMRVWLPLEV